MCQSVKRAIVLGAFAVLKVSSGTGCGGTDLLIKSQGGVKSLAHVFGNRTVHNHTLVSAAV